MKENYIEGRIIGTHINYYHVCPRKLWLFVNQFEMELTMDVVELGKFKTEKIVLLL